MWVQVSSQILITARELQEINNKLAALLLAKKLAKQNEKAISHR